MFKFILYFTVVSVSACAGLRGPTITSEWQDLQGAKQVQCAGWPMGEQDLLVNDYEFLKADEVHFLVNMRQRDTTQTYYIAPFTGRVQPDSRQIQQINFGPRSVLAGGLSLGSSSLVGVVVTNAQGRSQLQLRNIPQNTVAYRSAALEQVRSAQVMGDREGVWLAHQLGDEEQSVEALPQRVAYMPLSSGNEPLPIRSFAGVAASPGAQLVVGGNRSEAILVDLEQRPPRASFVVRRLRANGDLSQSYTLNLPVNSRVESWRASYHNGRLLLAYVDGDSLVGQANLKVARISWADLVPSVDFVRTKSLLNQHVSEPIWVTRTTDALVLIPKWVDQESTIAAYRVAGSEVSSQVLSGVFPRGMRIMDAFADPNRGSAYALIRQRSREQIWDYQLCQLPAI